MADTSTAPRVGAEKLITSERSDDLMMVTAMAKKKAARKKPAARQSK